jgi:hypothetical protein
VGGKGGSLKKPPTDYENSFILRKHPPSIRASSLNSASQFSNIGATSEDLPIICKESDLL